MSIQDLLASLDLEALERQAYEDVRSGKKTRRQKGVKMLRAVSGLKRSGVSPSELLIDRVPVIPAQYRPYSAAGDTFIPGDANELYADLIKARKIQDQTEDILGPDKETDRYVRQAVRAAFGYEDSPNPKLRARKISGLMQKILGSGPKTSFVQQKLLAKPQDFTGRAVIEPDPELGMDEIGVPADMAWEIYSPFIRRRLISKGIPATRALKLEKDRDNAALQAMLEEMKERPVMAARAPAWHHHNYLSFWPKLKEGNSIFISPYTTAGFGADFDGDAQFAYVQVLRRKTSI